MKFEFDLNSQLKQIETAWAKTLGAIELVEQLIKEQNSEEESE